MRTLGFSKLLSLGLLSAAMAGGCSSDYGLFNIHGKFNVSETAADRQNIERCRLSITDEGGGEVLTGYQLDLKKISSSTYVGCGGGQTPQDIGHLSYSTSRTAGQLKFTIDALDNTGTIVQSGNDTQAVKVFHSAADEVAVEITINKK